MAAILRPSILWGGRLSGYRRELLLPPKLTTTSSIDRRCKGVRAHGAVSVGPAITLYDTTYKHPLDWDKIGRLQTHDSAVSARPIFPFTAIIGQEEMRLALILNVVDPKIGGVMIMGDRGTGKTTAVRALGELLPKIKVVHGDPFNSDPDDADLMSNEVRKMKKSGKKIPIGFVKIPLVELPLGATEDRVCGAIDFERALIEGVKAFEPGVLAKANRGILYVDEVNLLDDHLVDVLLDSAASGWNTVEREGISITHPARFILVGSGNPEEGELRPQLLDRFGMHAQIRTVKDPELRVKIVNEVALFLEDPETYMKAQEPMQEALTARIVEAQKRVKQVKSSHEIRVKISRVCSSLDVDGIRGDIVSNRAARALAAVEGREEVTPSDVKRTIVLALRHRLRKDVFSDIDSGEKVMETFEKVFGHVEDEYQYKS